jgi:hypothetical protein
MDVVLQAFLSWQLVLFSLGIFFIVWMIRTLVEFCFPKVINHRVWTDLFLRLSPVIIGALVAKWATGYPYPTGPAESARIIFGLVAGGISSLLYGALKSMAGGYIRGMAQGILNVTNPAPCPPPPPIVQQVANPNTGQMGAGMPQ